MLNSKKRQKSLVFATALISVLSFAACGKGDGGEQSVDQAAGQVVSGAEVISHESLQGTWVTDCNWASGDETQSIYSKNIVIFSRDRMESHYQIYEDKDCTDKGFLDKDIFSRYYKLGEAFDSYITDPSNAVLAMKLDVFNDDKKQIAPYSIVAIKDGKLYHAYGYTQSERPTSFSNAPLHRLAK